MEVKEVSEVKEVKGRSKTKMDVTGGVDIVVKEERKVGEGAKMVCGY
jgi:hypothetical protein